MAVKNEVVACVGRAVRALEAKACMARPTAEWQGKSNSRNPWSIFSAAVTDNT